MGATWLVTRGTWMVCAALALGCGPGDTRDDDDDDDDAEEEEEGSEAGEHVMRFSVDGEPDPSGHWTGTAVTLYHLEDVRLDWSGGWTVGAPTVGAPVVDNVAEIVMPTPSDAAIYEEFPGTVLDFYLPVLHAEVDGDGAFEEGEVVIGGSESVLVWIGGSLPEEWRELGITRGWYVTWDDEIELPDNIVQTEELQLEITSWPTMTLTLGGTSAMPVADPARTGLAVVQADAWFAGEAPDPIVDQLGYDGGDWEITVSGLPPAAHLDRAIEYLDVGTVTYAMEVIVLYVDQNASGGLDQAAEIVGAACTDWDIAGPTWFVPELVPAWDQSHGWDAFEYDSDDEEIWDPLHDGYTSLVLEQDGC